MKRLVAFLLVTLFALSLTACAGMGKSEEKVRVKCPACGYEFDVEDPRP